MQVDPTTQKVTIDAERVPVVATCAAGQVVRRAASGWECAPVETWSSLAGKPATFPTTWAEVGGVNAATEWPGTVSWDRVTGSTTVDAQIGALQNDVGTIGTQISSLEERAQLLEGKPPAAVVATSCAALFAAGYKTSGPFTIDPSGTDPFTAYCDMEGTDGGWTMVYNSVLAAGTAEFWDIAYADRFKRRGRPSLSRNYYDGSIYLLGRTYKDVFEDLHEKVVVGLVATTTGINTTTMRFNGPVRVSGSTNIYANQFASGWSAPDYDGDVSAVNCATNYGRVTQHYSDCWSYNLGGDADANVYDSGVGPHVATGTLAGFYSDGSAYTRVRRISRFAKW